jgi:metacaspase-1
MRKRLLLISVISLACFSGSFSQSHLPEKHALIVAISNYSPVSGFRHIDADNDLKIIMKLLHQQGFTDTLVLANEQATKERVMAAFGKLLSDVHPGDVVYIHFSTHGQQIEDLNKDEADGLDEAIALYDSKASGEDGYMGQNHLSDDEFATIAEQLRKKLGKEGDVLVMVDACHSGSMTRGADTAIIRGGYPPVIFSDNPAGTTTRGDNQTISKSKNHESGFSGISKTRQNDLANWVIISACENDEVSSEYYYNHTYFGPLTWAFLNSFLSNNSETYTYNKLFHDIQFEMNSMFETYKTKQNPTVDCDGNGGLNKVIFGGRSVQQKKFYSVNSITATDRIIMEGGTISGIFDSTMVLVFPAGTIDPENAGASLSSGRIIHSGPMESVVQLRSPLATKKPGDYWVFLSERSLGGYRLKINLGSFTSIELKSHVLAELKNSRIAVLVSDTPSFVLVQKKNSQDLLTLEYGRSRKTYKDNISMEDLDKSLLQVAQAQFLKNMQVRNRDFDMDVSLLPRDTLRSGKTTFIDPITLRYTVKEVRDTAMLVITNTGKKGFYYNIIDIDPEDSFSVIVPNIDKSPNACFLKPGEKLKTFNTFGKPYGTETLKIIVSGQKFDLRPVINNPERSRDAMGDIETLFAGAYNLRGSPAMPDSGDLASFTFFFDIIK